MTMLRTLRYRWYYPRCFRLALPGQHDLSLWAFSPLWPATWRGRALWRNDRHGPLAAILTLGPLEFTLSFPARSRVARWLGREGAAA
jgi:hypothetical protein